MNSAESRQTGPHTPLPSSSAKLLHPGWSVATGLAALICGYLGLGLPQHYYQPLFALLVLLLAWRHEVILFPQNHWRWPLMIIYFCLLCLLFKLLIGGGASTPLAWLKVPVLEVVPPAEDASWYQKVVPNVDIKLQGVPYVSDWRIDITKIQTLLLVATMIGALTRFQPFASLTAIALLFVSFPTLVRFNWDWVLMFLILGSASFYLRSVSSLRPRHRQRSLD